MRRTGIICGVLLLGMIMAQSGWSGAASPAEAARRFIELFMNGDPDIAQFVTGAADPVLTDTARMAEVKSAAGEDWQVDLSGLKFEVLTQNKTEALVRMTGRMTQPLPAGVQTTNEDQVWLVRLVEGDWKVFIR